MWAVLGMACEGCAEGPCQSDAECLDDEVCLSGTCRVAGSPMADGGVASVADGGPVAQGDGGTSLGTGDDAGGGDSGSGSGSGGGSSGPRADGGTVDMCDRAERCSFEDEDCDGRLNNDLDCTFLASSEGALWRVDPFAQTIDLAFEVTLPGTEKIFDIDQAPDGSVYATTGSRKVYRVEHEGPVEVFGGTTTSNSPVPRNPNGLAIGDDGTFFISNQDALVGGRVVATGSLNEDPELLQVLDPYDSSGDCVIDKGSLLVSAVNLDDDDTYGITDLLIRVPFDGSNPALIGSFGFLDVYGLSSSFDKLFGVTADGKVLFIDRDTGAAELLFETQISFTGAGNRR